MKTIFNAFGAFAIIIASTPAFAGSGPVVQAVQVGDETARFQQGVITLDSRKSTGAVQITPLPMDHGSLNFGISVYNGGVQPANIDVTDFEVVADGTPLPAFTRSDLDKKAKNRAMWASIAVAAVGGLSAAAAASQRDTYRSTLVTPRGTYRAFSSGPSVVGQLQATAIAAGTGVAIANIQEQLDRTRQALGDQIVQLTTIDPGDSYGGRVVVAKIKNMKLPTQVHLTVHWNGADYPFAFQIVKAGTAAPVFRTLTPPVPMPASAPVPTPASATLPDATTPLPVVPSPPTPAPSAPAPGTPPAA